MQIKHVALVFEVKFKVFGITHRTHHFVKVIAVEEENVDRLIRSAKQSAREMNDMRRGVHYRLLSVGTVEIDTNLLEKNLDRHESAKGAPEEVKAKVEQWLRSKGIDVKRITEDGEEAFVLDMGTMTDINNVTPGRITKK